MTCATLAEAEALVAHRITDILISSELAGIQKITRWIALAARADVKAVVDDSAVISAIGAVARRTGCAPGLLVDVNVGHNRTGITPGEKAVELARRIVAEGLRFRGLMGYEGHVSHLEEGPGKERAYRVAMESLLACQARIEASGIPVEIVSTGGTGTHHLSRLFPGLTESQAGSYLLMDTNYARTCSDFEQTLSVLGTVTSKTPGERIVVDAGIKSISAERGLPTVKNSDRLRLRKLNAEHGIIDILDSAPSPEVGETLELQVHYSDATVNLHDRMYGVRRGVVEETLTLHG